MTAPVYQPSLFPSHDPPQPAKLGRVYDPSFIPPLASYDRILVQFSAGKDSAASVLYLLELGVPLEKLELWHQEIDGREGGKLLMDWPCTLAYCRAFANAFGIPLYYQWKEGGFEREMLRDNAPTARTWFELPDRTLASSGGESNSLGTRRLFPQQSASLTTRWCSAYLKVDVCASAIRNQPRFLDSRTLTISGERAEESGARAKYAVFEPDKADPRYQGKPPAQNGRWVDRWRPVHGWKETEVWDIIERWRINPHPAYRLGFGRVSCLHCIFGNNNQWASANVIDPAGIQVIDAYEHEFGRTIARNGRFVLDRIANGSPYPNMRPEDIAAALSREFNEPIFLPPGEWQLPAGAFGDSCGPV